MSGQKIKIKLRNAPEPDLWADVRRDVMRRLEDHAPTVPFEDRVRIAEDAAREVKSDAALFTPANVHATRVYRDCGHPADVEVGSQDA